MKSLDGLKKGDVLRHHGDMAYMKYEVAGWVYPSGGVLLTDPRRPDHYWLMEDHESEHTRTMSLFERAKPDLDTLAAEIVETVRCGDDDVVAAVKQALTDYHNV